MSFLMVIAGIALVVGIMSVPVMLGARIVGAEHTGFWRALLTTFMLGAVSKALDMFMSNEVLSFVVAAALSAALLAGILGTTFLRGLAVSIITLAIQTIVVLALVGTLFGVVAVAT